ncbi:MAG: hypothetical protein FWE36_08350 [Erysipelotrichales bacterium]|nr:hypothetical protein [Erysipelotrichales bacterium]
MQIILSAITPNSLNSYLLTVANPIDLVYNTSNIETTISLYMVTPLNGWFARRRAIISAWGDRKAAIVSRRVSSITNLVMDWWDGLDNWQKFAVGAGVLAAMTAATILTGGSLAVVLKGTKTAKLIKAGTAGAYINVGVNVAFALPKGRDAIVDGFALGVIAGAVTGPAAKAVGLATIGLKKQVIGKGAVYFTSSAGMQQVFFGNVCWFEAGFAGVFGMIGGRIDPVIGERVLANIGAMIGLSVGKKVTMVTTDLIRGLLWN